MEESWEFRTVPNGSKADDVRGTTSIVIAEEGAIVERICGIVGLGDALRMKRVFPCESTRVR